MKEKDFDISVRNILEDAEMPVSPKVWKGVSASIAPRRVVIPFWAYAMAGVAAAAAVAVGVFIHRPSESPGPGNMAIVAEAPSVDTTPVDVTVAVPIEKQIERLPSSAIAKAEPRRVAVHEVVAVNAVREEPVAQEQDFVRREVPTQVKAVFPVEASIEDDNAAFNQLIFSRKKSRRGFSFNATGDLQNSTRKPFSRSGALAPAVKQVPTTQGIYNATPEIAFGMPVAFGIGLTYQFADRLSVGSGLRYTWFSRTFVGDYYDEDLFPYENRDIDNFQHWLGVPVNIYYDLISSRYWHFHTFAGVGAEFLLSNNYRVHHTPQDVNYKDKSNYLMFSVGAGLGLEFKMSGSLGLFFDPSIRYYLNSAKAPRSIRTVQPLCVDVEAGLRFYL